MASQLSENSSPKPARATTFGLIALAGGIVVAGFLGLDRWFYEHVSCVLNHEDRPFDRTFYTATKPFWLALRYSFGYLYGAGVLYAVALLWKPQHWRHYTAAIVSVAVAAFVANVLQGAIGRVRPNQAETHLAFVPPFSELLTKDRVCFPSGEAATAFALAWIVARFVPRWRAVLLAIAALTAIARLINGAHYPSDIAAGAVLGPLVAAGVWRLATTISRTPAAVPEQPD